MKQQVGVWAVKRVTTIFPFTNARLWGRASQGRCGQDAGSEAAISKYRREISQNGPRQEIFEYVNRQTSVCQSNLHSFWVQFWFYFYQKPTTSKTPQNPCTKTLPAAKGAYTWVSPPISLRPNIYLRGGVFPRPPRHQNELDPIFGSSEQTNIWFWTPDIKFIIQSSLSF